MDHRTLRALDSIHGRDPDMAHVLTEILLQGMAKPKDSSPITSNTGINFNRLLQWPVPLYLISAGLLAANFTVPEVTELIKVFAVLQ